MEDQVVTFVRRGGPPDAPAPEPSGAHVPDWFRTLEQSIDSFPIPVDKTAKLCMPLNDAMRAGWMLRSPCDVHVREEGGRIEARVDADTDDDLVTTIDVEQPDRDDNSAFRLPECAITTPWAVRTPPGYSTLFTQPFNRDELRFTVPGMLVPTDDYEGPIAVPFAVERTAFTIEAGEPIAQVIPFRRDDGSLELDPKPFGADPAAEHVFAKWSEANTRRKDVYRKDAWVPKRTSRVVSGASELEDRSTEPSVDGGRERGGGDEDGDGGSLEYFCADELYDDLLSPEPAAEHVPDWYAERLRAIDGLDPEQPTAEWILDAMTLGAVVPLAAGFTARRTGEVSADQGDSPVEIETAGDRDVHHSQHPLKMGTAHPLAPVTLLNVNSDWVVKPPRGYSVLVCSPFGHFQRYYRAYAGIGDFDRYSTTANTPGLFTNRAEERSFPAGMAVAQHVPMHRDHLLHTAIVVDDHE